MLYTCDCSVMYTCIFVFCKQKTAYEMRISDWSSGVCSSDLLIPDCPAAVRAEPVEALFFLRRREKEQPFDKLRANGFEGGNTCRYAQLPPNARPSASAQSLAAAAPRLPCEPSSVRVRASRFRPRCFRGDR